MDTMNPYTRMEIPALVINHCSDISCCHPSCWASRKLYKRNAYLLMLKGVPPKEIRHEDQPSARRVVTHREIPTQKVHNIVNELFRSASDPDDWPPAARGISAGQLSIKHMPTPMSSLSRNASKLHHSEELGPDTNEEEDEADAAEAATRKVRKPVGQVHMQDMFQPSGPHSVYHSREYVWVPNPNRKPKSTLRRSEQDVVGRVNINEDLSQFLHEDTYNQRQAALQERAVERSHLSTARVQRFFKSMAPPLQTKHVDLFKLPSDLLSEVLRNVDQGEPMTDESLVRMVEQAEPGKQPVGGISAGANAASLGDFERHVLQQRRAQLHNSEARLTRHQPAAGSRPPVFLTDDTAAAISPTLSAKRLPPIPAKPQQPQRQKRQAGAAANVGAVSVVGDGARQQHLKRSVINTECQLMLGPVRASGFGELSAQGPSPLPLTDGRRTGGDAVADDDGAGSMDVECRSDRSTLLDEVLPTRQPGARDSGLAVLLAMNRPSYDLDDPWADLAEGPHTTTRNDSMPMTSSSPTTLPVMNPPGDEAEDAADDGAEMEAAVDGAEVGNEDEDASGVEAPTTPGPRPGMSPGPPPPSPDVEDRGAASSPPPPTSSKAKSAASSGQMPTLTEDEEGDN